MDEDIDMSVDTSDVDTSGADTSDIDAADVDTSDIPDDIPEDDFSEEDYEDEAEEYANEVDSEIPEDINEEDAEDYSDDVADEIPEDNMEYEDATDNAVENITEDTDYNDVDSDKDIEEDDIPEDIVDDEVEDTTTDVEEVESDEQNEVTEEVDDDTSAEETEDVTTDADEVVSNEQNEVTDEVVGDTVFEEVEDTTAESEEAKGDDWNEFADEASVEQSDDTATDTKDSVVDEQTDETKDEAADDVPPEAVENTTTDTQDSIDEQIEDTHSDIQAAEKSDLQKVLKRDKIDLLKLGNNAINQRLEAQADDYRDKGLHESEIKERLAEDKINFQKEFLKDAFPGQDVSENVFNGFPQNEASDSSGDISSAPTSHNSLSEGSDLMKFKHEIDNEIKDILDQNVRSFSLPQNGEWPDTGKPGFGDFTLDDNAEIKWKKNGNAESCSGAELKKWMQENYGVDTVNYEHKEPDFSPFEDKLLRHVKLDEMPTSRSGGSYLKAEMTVAKNHGMSIEEVQNYMKENELTWHECADRRTVRAIPTRINAAFKHSGGISAEKSIQAMRQGIRDRTQGKVLNLQRNGVSGTFDPTELDKAMASSKRSYAQIKKKL